MSTLQSFIILYRRIVFWKAIEVRSLIFCHHIIRVYFAYCWQMANGFHKLFALNLHLDKVLLHKW